MASQSTKDTIWSNQSHWLNVLGPGIQNLTLDLINQSGTLMQSFLVIQELSHTMLALQQLDG
jgi:hypothetical protein